MQYSRHLSARDWDEVAALYRWGARVEDICMLYNIHKRTMRRHLHRLNVPMRSANRPTLAVLAPHSSHGSKTKSSRPSLPAGARLVSDDQAPDQLLRSSAHAQRDMRIEERRRGVSTGSYQVTVSECRYAFLRNGNLLRDLE